MSALVDRHVDEALLPARERIVATALWFLGTPYKFGAKGAKQLDGVNGSPTPPTDCSGLVCSIFSSVFPDSGLEKRTDLGTEGLSVTPLFTTIFEPVKPQKGDIVFFSGHVGLVIDPIKRTFIHAPGARKQVRLADWNYMGTLHVTMYRAWSKLLKI